MKGKGDSLGKVFKFNFELRETTPINSDEDTDELDAENDGLDDPVFNPESEFIKVYDEMDDETFKENKSKHYTLNPILERVGCKINLDDRYYSKSSIR